VDRLQEYYAVFRERFGPNKLKSLDGQALLQTTHGLGNREGLVYWLEFKNDEEFPGRRFGSIAGGAAHKYGLFQRKETGQWVKGSPQREERISEAEAIEVARKHRDQLMAAVALLDHLPANSDDEHYRQLQDQMDGLAPDISGLGWAHKYLSLLFPDKLDAFHNHRWQRFNLIKLLQLPPQERGLYVAAGRFMNLAAQLSWPTTHLMWALVERNGHRPASYWRIGTLLGGEETIWPAMRDGSYIAIGWDDLGDLSALADKDDLKETIRERLVPYYDDPRIRSRKAGEIRDFVARIAEDDVAVASDGQRVLGLGKVCGPYRHENTEPTGAPHRRPVKWVSTAEWDLPNPEGLQTTVFPIRQHETNLIEIERRVLEGTPPLRPPRPDRLEGIPGRVQAILERKGQAILYGPPGTGKTYWARRTAFDMAALGVSGRPFDKLSPDERTEVEGSPATPGLVRFCTFHPAYGYEDFIEGFRPHSSEAGSLIFELRDGIFKALDLWS
jgi:5-methylcytosine-specific restriction protein B